MEIFNYIDVPGQAIYLMEKHNVDPAVFYSEMGFIQGLANSIGAEKLFIYTAGRSYITTSIVKSGESVLLRAELSEEKGPDHYNHFIVRATCLEPIRGLSPMKAESSLEDLIITQVILYQSINRSRLLMK